MALVRTAPETVFSERSRGQEPLTDYELRYPKLMFTEETRVTARDACQQALDDGTVDYDVFVRLHNMATYGRSHQARHFFTRLVLAAPDKFCSSSEYINSFPRNPDTAYTSPTGQQLVSPGLPILPFNFDDIGGAFMAAQNIIQQPDNK